MAFAPESFPLTRLRRTRSQDFSRQLVRETQLAATDFIYPLFVTEGENTQEPIDSMPDISRFSIDLLLQEIDQCQTLGIQAIALFPVIAKDKKTPEASEATNINGLIPRAITAVKDKFPHLGVMTDIALDPYTTHGHDGIVDEQGYVINDQTVDLLVQQALTHAKAGVDIVAPSDMMDGRIQAIRQALEAERFVNTQILAYSAKYASAFYGPFREAVGSVTNLKKSSKSNYQMDPANSREAIREVQLDIQEGADMVMIKPGMPYLDVISNIKSNCHLPVVAYQVSGEYAMHMAAAKQGWLDEKAVGLESLLCFKRAGADVIITYFAKKAAKWLNNK